MQKRVNPWLLHTLDLLEQPREWAELQGRLPGIPREPKKFYFTLIIECEPTFRDIVESQLRGLEIFSKGLNFIAVKPPLSPNAFALRKFIYALAELRGVHLVSYNGPVRLLTIDPLFGEFKLDSIVMPPPIPTYTPPLGITFLARPLYRARERIITTTEVKRMLLKYC